jgi:hypothetical protein
LSPLASPETVHDVVVVAVHVCPPLSGLVVSTAVTVYPLTGAPLVDVGGCHEIVTDPADGVVTMLVGDTAIGGT